MKATHRKPSQAVTDGQAAGVRLAGSAARVFLVEYNNRPLRTESASTRQWCAAWESLRAALGAMADDANVVAALRTLDDAHGEALVEHEDAAWHAAWTLAMHLRCK